MPRRLSPLVTNHYYHVYNRGVDRRHIFGGLGDYYRFLEVTTFYSFSEQPTSFSEFSKLHSSDKSDVLTKLRESVPPAVEINCFCLIPNHFHFLLKQVQNGGISTFMTKLQNSYSHYFNIRHERVGTLFQGVFKAVHVESEGQLLHLSRYIHLNPYSASVVGTFDELLEYPWSSLPEYLNRGMQSKVGTLYTEVVSAQFPRAGGYESFLRNHADHQKDLEKIKASPDPGSGKVIG